MPHMQRLTWTGIALHAGHLPGYPASAGCVRLPVDFAAKLYTVTSLGTTVIIADSRSAPSHSTQPGLLFSGKSGSVEAGAVFWAPEKAPRGAVSIIISGADRTVYLYRNGVEIGRAPVSGSERLSGSHVYSALATVDADGRRDWVSIASSKGRAPNLKDLARRDLHRSRFSGQCSCPGHAGCDACPDRCTGERKHPKRAWIRHPDRLNSPSRLFS